MGEASAEGDEWEGEGDLLELEAVGEEEEAKEE